MPFKIKFFILPYSNLCRQFSTCRTSAGFFNKNSYNVNVGQAPDIHATLGAGLDISTGVTTVNKVCSSGLKSIMLAAQQIQLNHQQCVIGGGMESLNQPTYDGFQKFDRLGPSAPMICPTTSRILKIYSFPTLSDKAAIELPSHISLLLEKSDPININTPMIEDPSKKPTPLIAGPRMLVIRKHKMMKHKRRKRWDRDYFRYQKIHAHRKQKAEILFRSRMKELTDELETFDPLEHIKKTIKSAKREWKDSAAPTGRKKYPHWSQLMTLEELYGLEKSEYIDKRYGLPNQEDKAKIAHIKADYLKKYVIKED